MNCRWHELCLTAMFHRAIQITERSGKSFDSMASAPVFGGRSLNTVWDEVTVLEIDGCDPEERLRFYIGNF